MSCLISALTLQFSPQLVKNESHKDTEEVERNIVQSVILLINLEMTCCVSCHYSAS